MDVRDSKYSAQLDNRQGSSNCQHIEKPALVSAISDAVKATSELEYPENPTFNIAVGAVSEFAGYRFEQWLCQEFGYHVNLSTKTYAEIGVLLAEEIQDRSQGSNR